MKQQINFLKFIPTPPQRLPAKLVILTLIIALSVITFLSIMQALNQVHNYIRLLRAHNENNRITMVFQQTAKSHPLLASDMPLATQIAVFEKELQEKKHNFEVITGSALRYGFSNYLEALAQIVPPGLWLNRILINQEAKTALLSGFMLKPIDISLLLQALQVAPAFTNTFFNIFYIKNIPEKIYTEFNVTNDFTLVDKTK